MLRRALCALAALALLAAGCTRSEPVAAPSPSQSPTESPSPEPPPVAPLTGVELPEAIDRPVLAVKIDNASAALPPDGLEDADMVFEEEAEGGITRFLALFHSTDPQEVGPVRSGREADADLLPPFNAVLATSGAAGRVKSMFRDAGLIFFEEGEADGAFYRVTDRVSPHNLFARTEPLWAQAEDLELLDETVQRFDEQAPSDGEDTETVQVTYSPYANAQWQWDSSKDHWEREQNGSPHATAQGRTVSASNVVVMRVQTSVGSRKDMAGNPTLDLKIVGKGRAVYFRDGQEFKGRWVKDAREEHIRWLDADNEPFAFRPGSTFVQVLPVDDAMTTTRPSPSEEPESDG